MTASSAPIHPGRKKDTAHTAAASGSPTAGIDKNERRTVSRALSSLPAPKYCAVCTEKPSATAATKPETNHMKEEHTPMAAVAVFPSEPTIAVSMYETQVIMSCSIIAGSESFKTVRAGVFPARSEFVMLFMPYTFGDLFNGIIPVRG